jgi:hypothetical protein
MVVCSGPSAGWEITISWRGNRGTSGNRPVIHPNSKRMCTRMLAATAIQGQGGRFRRWNSNCAGKGASARAFKRATQPFGSQAQPIGTDR